MKPFGLLGRQLSHSWSPALHGLLGDYEYRLFEKEPGDLGPFLESRAFQGLNVTTPYKQAVIPYLQALSPRAQQTGSVNTIVQQADGSLWGENTDYVGFSFLLEQSGLLPGLAGQKALILGSGGAAMTVKAVLEEYGLETVIISRRGPDHYEKLSHHRQAALLVNATPLGMYPLNGQLPLSLSELPALKGVLDLIYNPARTALIMEAERRGIPAFGGLPMLAAQGAASAACWGLCDDPRAAGESLLPRLQKQRENIIFIGMPGCGKSSLGRALAAQLDRPFLDSDEEVERALGQSPADYIQARGEEAFRQAETRILARLGALSAHVIATGGGAVTRAENYPLLHQNGLILWLQRDPEKLATQNRPLSQQAGPWALYTQRAPAYEAFADRQILLSEDPLENLKRIQEVLL